MSKVMSSKIATILLSIVLTVVIIGETIAVLTSRENRPEHKVEVKKEHKVYNVSVGNTMLEAEEYGTIFYEKINSYSYDPSDKSITITYYNDLNELTYRLKLFPEMTTMFLLKYKKWRGEISND